VVGTPRSDAPFAIEARGLTKWFPPQPGWRDIAMLRTPRGEGTLAVDRVSFEVRRGEIFGLLGPNGAGKTTLIKLLATLVLPTSGTAWVNGLPLARTGEIRETIGLMTSNERSFYHRLTCRENLAFYGGLYHLTPARCERKVAELTAMLDMDGFLDKRYDRCSSGMKQRLALARALLNDASLLLLDEPTVTLDPVAAAQFRERLYALARRESRTLLVVTHNPDEAVELCDRVAVMIHGHLRTVGAPDRLRALLQSDGRCELRVRGFTHELAEGLRALSAVRELGHQAAGDVTRVELQLRDRKRSLPAIVTAVEDGGGTLEELSLATASWERVAERLDMDDDGADEVRVPDDGEGPGATDVPSDGPRLRLPQLGPRLRELGPRLHELGQTLPLFLRRDFRTQMSYRLSFVLQLFGILFSIASFYFVSQVFGLQASPYLEAYGGDYFSFVLIGIAFVGYQGVALHTFSGVIQSAQTMGTLEAMLTTPTRLSTILLGSSAWNFIFTSIRVVLYLLAGVLFFGAKFGEANFLSALVVLALTVISLSGIGILSASFIMAFKRGSPINFLVGSFSTLLGGVYYPVEVLPGWLELLARFYPLTYALQAMRRALLTGATVRALGREIGLLVAFSAVLVPAGLVAFRYAVQRAKRDGSLTQF
jgi:ABC-2 type transport system permease protein